MAKLEILLQLFITLIISEKCLVLAKDEYENNGNHYKCNHKLINALTDKKCVKNINLTEDKNLTSNILNKNFTELLKNLKNNIEEEYDYSYDNKEKSDFDSAIDSINNVYNENEIQNYSQNIDSINGTFNKLNKVYVKLYENLKPVENRLKQRLFEFIYSLELSKDCLASFIRINKGLNSGQLWAFKFFDSIGRIPSGLTEGIATSFGEYDECLDIESPHSDTSETFYGKYCLAKPSIQMPSFEELNDFKSISFLNEKTNQLIKSEIKNNLNTFKLMLIYTLYSDKWSPFRLGICIPSKCSASEIQNAINKVIYPMVRIPTEVGPECHVKHEKLNLNTYQIVLLTILMIQIFLVTISTTIDVYLNKFTSHKMISKDKFICKKWITSFSITESTKTLFSIRNNRLLFVDTIMMLYFIWIIAAQYYLAPITIGFMGYKHIFNSFILKILSEKQYFWLRTYYPKDSVFLVFGILTSYDFFGDKHKAIRLTSYPKFIFEKWFRFSLKIIGPIIVLNVISVSGDGPLWHLGHQFFVKSCSTNYWKSLLFINNFVQNLDEICNTPSFVISILFQLQILSPLFMLPLKYSPKKGLIFNYLVIIFGAFLSILPKLLFGTKIIPFEVSDMNSINEMKYSFVRFSIFTDQNLSVFVIGIIVGFLMRNELLYHKIFININNRIFLSILCPILSIIAIIWSENFKDINESPNELNLMVWFAFGKILWSFGNIWFIYFLFTGSKGIVYRILSSKIFRPLTRLSFGICLLNNMIINYRLFTRRENFTLNHINQIQILVFDVLIMIIISYLIYILFESPFIQLFQNLKNRKEDKNVVNNNDINNNDKHTNGLNELTIVCEKRIPEVELKFVFPID